MYLVCRLGGAERLSRAYDSFGELLSKGASNELQKAPSLAAYAYAMARRAASQQDEDSRADLSSIPWVPTPQDGSPRYGEVLDRLRSQLPSDIAEAMELHFARGLSADEVAYVMGTSPPIAVQSIADGTKLAESIASGPDWELNLDRLVRDAFQPRTVSDSMDAKRLHARPTRLAEGSLIGGRFEVSSAGHTRASGSIYLAEDSSVPGQSVILHLLHRTVPTTAARNGMLRKMRLLGSVVHASIGRILDYGWHADRLWYATPWYEGHTLEQLVQQGSLSPIEAIDIFVPLAGALSAMHQQGVVHRDITESKILILRVGTKGAYEALPLLTGFDSWLLGEVPMADEPRALAPEVAKRVSQGAETGAAAPGEDVFALALALLRSLDSSARRKTEEPWSAFLARRAGSSVEVGDSARVAPFARTLRRALSLNPEERPTAAELAKALEEAKPRVAEDRSRRGLLVPLAIVVAAAALILVTYFVRQSRLRLIDETHKAADAEVLEEELEAERARSKQLEEQLSSEGRSPP